MCFWSLDCSVWAQSINPNLDYRMLLALLAAVFSDLAYTLEFKVVEVFDLSYFPLYLVFSQ